MKVNDNGHGIVPDAPQPALRIVIELDPATRRLQVNATVKDPTLVLGMLEHAKAAFQESLRQPAIGPRIEIAPPGMKI